MVLLEMSVLKPIMVAGGSLCLLDRAGLDLTKLPLISGFISDEEGELGARYFCCFGRRRKVKKPDDEESGMQYFIPTAMCVIGAMDVVMGGVLLESLYLPVDQPLKEWLFGSLMLSYPTSLLVYNAAKVVSFKHAFLVESAANMASFAWLAWGLIIVSKSAAYKTAPLLFWTIYVTCVTSWSVIGTSMLGLILTTVVAILFGNKGGAIAA